MGCFRQKVSTFKIVHPVLYDLEDEYFTSGFILPSLDNL